MKLRLRGMVFIKRETETVGTVTKINDYFYHIKKEIKLIRQTIIFKDIKGRNTGTVWLSGEGKSTGTANLRYWIKIGKK